MIDNIFIAQFITVALAHLLAVISPGPDFIIVSKNSITYSRKIGIYTALGIAMGLLVHIFYSLLGIGLIISQSIVLFNLIKVLGALYLIYLGYKMLRSKPEITQNDAKVIQEKKINKMLSPFGAIKNGFLVNVLNPKATLFFLALFTQVINPETSQVVKMIYGVEMIIVTFVWFTIVSFMFSNKTLKTKINKVQHHIDRFTGAIFILLGLKVLTSER